MVVAQDGTKNLGKACAQAVSGVTRYVLATKPISSVQQAVRAVLRNIFSVSTCTSCSEHWQVSRIQVTSDLG
eukprot:1512395-Rhodomonas_salina.1